MNKIRQIVFAGTVSAMVLFGAGFAGAQTTSQTNSQTKSQNKTATKTAQTKTAATPLKAAPTPAGSGATDEFFIISSYNKAHNTLVVLRPTQITADLVINDKTQLVDEQGKPIKITDLATGATVFASYTAKPDGTLTATHIRKGVMTFAEMRKRYLPGLPVTTSQTTATAASK
jgi:hypothetical protein